MHSKMRCWELLRKSDRLLRKGILNGEVRGKLEFALPFFDEYVLEHI